MPSMNEFHSDAAQLVDERPSSSGVAALVDLVRRAYDRFTDNDMQPPNHELKRWLADAESAMAKAVRIA